MRLDALLDAPYAFGSTYEREVDTADGDWRDRLEARSQFVAEIDGVVVGTAGAYVKDAAAAELVSMWVAPHARGKGAGDALVGAVVGWARAEGHAVLGLWVAAGNDPAERLYARHGFVRTGVEKQIRPDSSRLEFAMALQLAGGAP